MSLQGDAFLEALLRGREDHEFFGAVFLNRPPHPGQLDFLENANATINVLPTSNRWGKTTIFPHRHFHSCIYKIGGEPRYISDDGRVDQGAFERLRYHTIHTAFGWDTTALVWDEAHKLLGECPNLAPFITDAPRSHPPHIDFYNGARWKFRTLGDNASGIDGNSFYLVTVDEAGWIPALQEMMDNVIRVRVADVRGRIDLAGTMKPGISRDFFKYGTKAAIYCGTRESLDYREDDDDPELTKVGDLAPSIRKLCRMAGVTADELRDAMELAA